MSDVTYPDELHDLINRTGALIAANSSVIAYLAPNPFDVVGTSVRDVLTTPCNELVGNLQTLFAKVGEDIEARGIVPSMWAIVTQMTDELHNAHQFGDVILAHELGRRAMRIRQLVNDAKQKLPNQLVKAVVAAANELCRLSCLYNLTVALEELDEAHTQFAAILQTATISGPSAHRRSSISMLEVVKASVEWNRERSGQNGTTIKFDVDRNPVAQVLVDPLRLRKSVDQLLDNAIKYTGELPDLADDKSTWIDVWIDELKKEVQLSVESWGLPITEEELRHDLLFKRGYRGFFAQMVGAAGSGTGLFAVHAFAVQSGGRVEVRSDPVPKPQTIPKQIRSMPKRKTTVVITLPRR